jgi:hypothetical protein
LAGIDIVVFQKENLVYAIFLERTELDEKTNSPSQRLLNDQVLLASDLRGISLLRVREGSAGSLTYSFQQVEQISPSLVCYFLGVDCPDGGMGCHHIVFRRQMQSTEEVRLETQQGNGVSRRLYSDASVVCLTSRLSGRQDFR